MKVTGKITHILEKKSGTNKAGNEWESIDFVIEIPTDNPDYQNSAVFTVFGADKVRNFLQYNKVGQNVDVSFNLEAREWEGRFFQSLKAWKVYASDKDTQPQQATTPPPAASYEGEDNLPF